MSTVIRAVTQDTPRNEQKGRFKASKGKDLYQGHLPYLGPSRFIVYFVNHVKGLQSVKGMNCLVAGKPTPNCLKSGNGSQASY